MKDNRKVIQVLTILTIIFTIMGGSLAYWTWQSDSSTKVTFSVGSNFSCSVDGGGNINQTSANEYIAPATCTNEDYAIKRKVVVTPSITKNDLTISMDLWLDIDNLGTGLSDSYNFKYVLSTSESSCEGTNIVNSGTFHGKTTGDTVVLLDRKTFTGTAATSQTYWLYIWLDKAETSDSTMNQPFSFSLNGSCTDNPGNIPNAPVLDDAMIPVTIADNGDVTTVSETDPTWYDYENKEWANVVLVKEEGLNNRQYYLDNPNQPVEEEDILAYYVWIPRYKYRMSEGLICGNLINPTKEEYPECFDEYEFTISEENAKKKIEDYVVDNYYGDCYTGEDDENGNGIYDCSDIVESIYDTIVPTGTSREYDNPFYTDIFIDDIFAQNEYKLVNNKDKEIINEQSIDIVFEDKNDFMITGDAINTYYSHPGFWWDDNENNNVDNGETLAGIWVSKFEMQILSGDGDPMYGESGEKILPNLTFSDDVLIFDGFAALADAKQITRSGNIYGFNNTLTNSHAAKNSEWGAISYLTHSKYGINKNIEKNNTYTTGGGTYGTLSSYPQSTTGNISGVFDMSGGMGEWMMVGFTGYNNRSGKYYNVYDNYSVTETEYPGHALYEWYGNENNFDVFNETSGDIVFFIRRELFTVSSAENEGPTGGFSYRTILINGFGS